MGRVFYSYPVLQSLYPFQTETNTWASTVVSNGGSVTTTRKILVDNLIVSLKGHGLFTKLDRLWLHAAENQVSGLVDIINDQLATAVSSPTFAANVGFTFDGTSNYLDTGFVLNFSGTDMQQNSASMGAYVTNSVGPGAGTFEMMIAGFDIRLYATLNTNALGYQVFGTSNAPGNIFTTGFWVANRSSSTATAVYKNGSSAASNSSDTSSASAGGNIYVGSRGAADFGHYTIAGSVIGASLSSTEMSNLSTDINTYMTALGINVY